MLIRSRVANTDPITAYVYLNLYSGLKDLAMGSDSGKLVIWVIQAEDSILDPWYFAREKCGKERIEMKCVLYGIAIAGLCTIAQGQLTLVVGQSSVGASASVQKAGNGMSFGNMQLAELLDLTGLDSSNDLGAVDGQSSIGLDAQLTEIVEFAPEVSAEAVVMLGNIEADAQGMSQGNAAGHAINKETHTVSPNTIPAPAGVLALILPAAMAGRRRR